MQCELYCKIVQSFTPQMLYNADRSNDLHFCQHHIDTHEVVTFKIQK